MRNYKWTDDKGNVQQTSILAWNKINKDGAIGKQQAKVYTILKKYGPCSNMELSKYARIPINAVTPRMYELRKKGLVTNAGKGKCNITGSTVNMWIIK